MSKTLGLALGSGGARGVAHIGFIKALEEEGIKPDFISGSSMGAVIGSCYAKGMKIDEIRDITLKIKTGDIIDFSASAITKLGLLRSKKVQRIFLQYLGDVTFDELDVPFTCTAVDLYSGKLHVFDRGSVALAVQASSAIPTVFRPVAYEDKLLVDGGVLCRVPVEQVKAMGADVVVAVDVLVNTSKKVEDVSNIFSMVLRLFDIMDNNATLLSEQLYPEKCDLVLKPAMEGMSPYAIKELDRAYEEGYQVGKDHIDKIKELLKD